MSKLATVILTTVLAVLTVSGLITYLLVDRSSARDMSSVAERSATTISDAAIETNVQSEAATTNSNGGESFFSKVFGLEESAPASAGRTSFAETAVTVAFRFALATLLAALLAFRPRRRIAINQRNPYVAQTQILLSVVAAAMMMIVGDSAARAFGIFAAASLVRFRTNIRDPKEITVLLICLGVGLAAGVGRGELAIMLSFFVLLTLWILEYFESTQVFRAMEVTIETRDMDKTHDALKRIFAQHKFSTELRELKCACDDDPTGKVVYHVKLSPVIDTNKLSEEIISADPQNIGSVEWAQKKSTTYIYN